MERGPENRDYGHLTRQLAEQFARGEVVDTGILTYLRDFSDESRQHYDLLMDRIADMYEVEPVNVGRTVRARTLGKLVIGQSNK